jgi:hypothetical protein
MYYLDAQCSNVDVEGVRSSNTHLFHKPIHVLLKISALLSQRSIEHKLEVVCAIFRSDGRYCIRTFPRSLRMDVSSPS